MTNESEIKLHNSSIHNNNNNNINSNSLNVNESHHLEHRIIPISAKIPLDNDSTSTTTITTNSSLDHTTTLRPEELNGHNGSQPAQNKAIEATIELLIEKVELEASSQHIPEPKQENGTGNLPTAAIDSSTIHEAPGIKLPPVDAPSILEQRDLKQAASQVISSNENVIKLEPVKSAEVVQNLDLELDNHEEEPKVYVDISNLTRSSQQSSQTGEASSTEIDSSAEATNNEEGDTAKQAKQSKKRSRADSKTTTDNDEPSSEGRSKRQRTQTKLFQVTASSSTGVRASSGRSSVASGSYTTSPAPKPTANRKSNAQTRAKAKTTTKTGKSNARQSTSSSKRGSLTKRQQVEDDEDDDQELPPQLTLYDHVSNDQKNVIYEKNDILAIRNEEGTFYLCQLTENVRVMRATLKIRWLDTKDGGNTYFLTNQYDSIPHQSILLPVTLHKLKKEKSKEQFFTLENEIKDMVVERLKRSLTSEAHMQTSSQESEQNEATTATTDQAN